MSGPERRFLNDYERKKMNVFAPEFPNSRIVYGPLTVSLHQVKVYRTV